MHSSHPDSGLASGAGTALGRAIEHALLAAYPSLRAEDLVNAWAYVRSHATEVEAQINENEAP